MTTPETTRAAQMAKVFAYLKGLHATHLIDLGVQLHLFERLAETPAGLAPESLAGALGLSAEPVRRWCETACALELLDHEPPGRYRLAPFMDELLGRPEATYYVGGFPAAHLLIARDYECYPDVLGGGQARSYQEHDEAFFRSVAEALRTLPQMFLDAVLPKLPNLQARLLSGARVLDVGCGGGYALVAFAERFPAVRCVGIEVEPTSVDLARRLIAARGLDNRVEVHLVDGATWPSGFSGAFDLVTMFLVLHEIRPELKDAVLAQCARALRPGGLLLLFDERYPSGPAELRDPAQVFAVLAQWYELSWGNVINTCEEMQALLNRQGLRVVAETAFSRFYIVVAEVGEQRMPSVVR